MGKFIDLTGKTFGKLTVIKKTIVKKSGALWECVCSCGNPKIVSTGHLTSGDTKSCGCLHGEYHGMKGTPEYKVWQGMKRRCYNKHEKSFFRYGGRGITVCDEWVNSFTTFFKDMGSRPDSNLSIDRIDNTGNYSANNCKWSTRKEQANNRRSNKTYTYKGVISNQVEWSEAIGIDNRILHARINRYGWSIDRAFNTPVRRK